MSRLKTWIWIWKKRRIWKRRHPRGLTTWQCASPSHTCIGIVKPEARGDCWFFFPSAKHDEVGSGSLFPCQYWSEEWVLFKIIISPVKKSGAAAKEVKKDEQRVHSLEAEIKRLNLIAFGETECDVCCNAKWSPLLGCGLTTEQWQECTGYEKHHYYWNKKMEALRDD